MAPSSRQQDARAFANSVETDMLRGQYLDPKGSKTRFGEFAERWAASLTVDAKTAEGIASRLRAHLLPVLPAFGDLELRHIKPSTIQGWLGGLARTHEPSYVRLLLGTLSTILGAAVEDDLIPSNPRRSRSVKAPALPDARRAAWDPATVDAVCDGLSDRHRALDPVGAGLGLRQGEAFGLGVDMVDFLRREVDVRRQVKWLSGRGLVFAPPKRGKARIVPLPEVVAVALAEHIRRFPPVEVTLPWTGKGGGEVTVPLVFTNTAGGPLGVPRRAAPRRRRDRHRPQPSLWRSRTLPRRRAHHPPARPSRRDPRTSTSSTTSSSATSAGSAWARRNARPPPRLVRRRARRAVRRHPADRLPDRRGVLPRGRPHPQL
jgi:hypothetical protein